MPNPHPNFKPCAGCGVYMCVIIGQCAFPSITKAMNTSTKITPADMMTQYREHFTRTTGQEVHTLTYSGGWYRLQATRIGTLQKMRYDDMRRATVTLSLRKDYVQPEATEHVAPFDSMELYREAQARGMKHIWEREHGNTVGEYAEIMQKQYGNVPPVRPLHNRHLHLFDVDGDGNAPMFIHRGSYATMDAVMGVRLNVDVLVIF